MLLLAGTIRAQQVQWASTLLGFSSEKSVEVTPGKFSLHQYHAEQVLGKPNKCPATGDSPCAWLPAADFDQGTQEEWVKVGFDKPMKIQQVAIAQNFYPGAIEKVILYDERDRQRAEFDYTPSPDGLVAKIKHVTFEKTAYPVAAVKIVLQPGLVPGQNEIDAIAISDGSAYVEAPINVAPGIEVGPKENLGPGVNSPYDDLLPVISPDGKTLFIARMNHPQNFGIDDNIWYTTLDDHGNWLPVKNIGPALNNGGSSYVSSVTPDGNTLLIAGSFKSKDSKPAALWLTHRTAQGWSYPEPVRVKDFYTYSIYSEYSLSNDGRTIILSLDRADSYGRKDLYVSFLQKDGSWSAPKNLGPTVNSASDEATPFIASDGKTLYFASDGFAGYGSMDMYFTRRLDSTWQHWSEPQNLGPKLNSETFDAYYTVPASGEYAYFVSYERSYGLGDIFRVKLPEALRPKAVVLISGKVLDAKTGKPLEAKIKYELLSNGKEIGSASTSPATGIYKITLPAGENYGYRAEAPGYIPVSENLDLTKADRYQELARDLMMVPIQKGETVRLNNIFFEVAKAELRSESFAELDRIVKLLGDNPTMEIAIYGHTDSVGSEGINKGLSEARAKAVQTYLLGKGIVTARLRAKGFGDTKPIAPNSTDEGRQQNRRVEFTILKQ
jgi:outer membrane protein OmpA-like peptidoglycan-associated protein